MKKLLLLLTLIIPLTFASCIDNNSLFVKSSALMPDFQYQFKILGAKMPTQKSDSGYYNVCSGKIVFTDKESMKTIPLCSKPDCTHDGYSPDCSAVIHDPVNCFDNFQIYRDKLYRIGFNYSEDTTQEIQYLRECSLDGTNSRVALEFNSEAISDWFIYNGYFYYQPLISSDNTEQDSSGNLFRMNLENRKKDKITDFSKLDGIYNAEASFRNLYEGYAYFTLYGYKNEEDYKKLISVDEFDGNIEPILKIVRVNLNDGHCEFVSPYDDYDFVGFSDGKLVGATESSVIISGPDGSNPNKIINDYIGSVYCDDNYIYTVQSSNRNVTVYNKRGDIVSTSVLPEEAVNSINNITFYDDYLWFDYYAENGNSYLCYIKKSDLLVNGTEVVFYETYEFD